MMACSEGGRGKTTQILVTGKKYLETRGWILHGCSDNTDALPYFADPCFLVLVAWGEKKNVLGVWKPRF